MQAKKFRFFCGGSATNEQLNSTMFQDTKLIIMDIDGTVLDKTIPHYWRHLNIARVRMTNAEPWESLHFLEYFKDLMKTYNSGWISRQHIVAAMINEEQLNHERVLQGCKLFYESFHADFCSPPLFPQCRELLHALQEQAIRILAYSDTEHQLIERMLNNHNIAQYFHRVVGDTRKPNLDVLHNVLAEHPELPQQTGKHILVIGDSLATDGALAKKAGCRFIYFCGGKPVPTEQEIERKIAEKLIPKDTIVVDTYEVLLRLLMEAVAVDRQHQACIKRL